MIKCIVIDDEPIALEIIEEYINKVNFLVFKGGFRTVMDALGFLQTERVDLIVLDINMPDINGIELTKLLPSPRPLIIFCTAYSEYAVESYNLEVLDYLLKPVKFDRFMSSALKAKASFEANTQMSNPRQIIKKNEEEPKRSDYILIKSGTEIQKINLKEISYVEGTGNYVTIHTTSRRIMSLQSMKDFMAHLPDDTFFRVHKSYIISFDFVKAIENHQVKIGDKTIPIGSTYRNDFKRWLSFKK